MATPCKFEKNMTLSHKEIRGKRAQLITEDVKIAQDDLIKSFSDEKRALERKLLELEDLSPDSELSLHPGKKDFDPVKWVNEVNNAKVKLAMLEIKINIAEGTKKEFFNL